MGFRGALTTRRMRSGNRSLQAMPIRRASCVKYDRYSLRHDDAIGTVASPFGGPSSKAIVAIVLPMAKRPS